MFVYLWEGTFPRRHNGLFFQNVYSRTISITLSISCHLQEDDERAVRELKQEAVREAEKVSYEGSEGIRLSIVHEICFTGPGLVWPRLASSGLVWPRLASSGLVWPRLASSGLVWPRLASSGLVWPRLASSGLVWPRLARANDCLS